MKDKQINENKPWLQTRIRNCQIFYYVTYFFMGLGVFMWLSDFVMCRWDGEQAVRYLEPDEVDQIEGYAKKHIPKSKWVKKRAPKRKYFFDFMT